MVTLEDIQAARLEPVDTLPVTRCGCVPSLGVLYEEEDPGLAEAEYGGSRGAASPWQ